MVLGVLCKSSTELSVNGTLESNDIDESSIISFTSTFSTSLASSILIFGSILFSSFLSLSVDAKMIFNHVLNALFYFYSNILPVELVESVLSMFLTLPSGVDSSTRFKICQHTHKIKFELIFSS